MQIIISIGAFKSLLDELEQLHCGAQFDDLKVGTSQNYKAGICIIDVGLSRSRFLVCMAHSYFKYCCKFYLMQVWISEYPWGGQRYPEVNTTLPVRPLRTKRPSWVWSAGIRMLTDLQIPNSSPLMRE